MSRHLFSLLSWKVSWFEQSISKFQLPGVACSFKNCRKQKPTSRNYIVTIDTSLSELDDDSKDPSRENTSQRTLLFVEKSQTVMSHLIETKQDLLNSISYCRYKISHFKTTIKKMNSSKANRN